NARCGLGSRTGLRLEIEMTHEVDAWTRLIDDLWQANPMSRLVPLNAGEVARSFQTIWLDTLRNPERGLAAYTDFVSQATQIWTNATLQMWGLAPQKPVAAPEPGDKRFSAPDW